MNNEKNLKEEKKDTKKIFQKLHFFLIQPTVIGLSLCECAHLNVMVPWPFSYCESMSIHWSVESEMQAPIPLPTLR